MVAVRTQDDDVVPVEIRLLGPVEVVDSTGSSRLVPLGGPRQRTLVAALALRAPEVVSRSTLVDGVWDSNPPAKADKTLRAHVAHLRRSLLTGGVRGLVATRSPGYALAAPAGCVDVHRFQELVATARAEPAAEAAARLLRTALQLWRGDPVAGCPAGEWIRAEATRLQEVRLCATEELFAAELALGRHSRLVADIEAMVARHPLRERLWELLMRALYRAGRQGDALHAYRRARARLVAEIGVEPGASLRRLEAAILAGAEQDGGPAVPGQRADRVDTERAGPERISTGGPEPASLDRAEPVGAIPTSLTNLVGRQAEISELSGALRQRRLITLTGVGGCGKTRLAMAVAGVVAAEREDGVRFVDLTSLTDPELVAGTVAAVLGVPAGASGADRGALAELTAHLRHRKCLLVLDNCEHVVRSCAELVTALLRHCPELRVLATSRETLGVLGEVSWPVPPLPVPPPPDGQSVSLAALRRYDAVRLFLDRATLATVRGLTDADAPAVAALCAGLDGLPLAIELAAARTSVLTVAEIADRLHEPALLHTSRHPDRPHHRGLDSAIAWSYDLLDPLARSCFRRLAVFSGGFTLAAAEAVWPQLGEQSPVDVLSDLVAKSLVVMERRADVARYRLLETIGRWAACRLAECPDDEQDARRRHACYHLTLLERGDEQLRGPQLPDWLDRLAAEHENLRSALTWFAGSGDQVERLRMAAAAAQYCVLRDRYADGRRWLDAAIAAAAHTPDVPDVLLGRALAATARFAMLMCDYDHAQQTAELALTVQRRPTGRPPDATLRLLASIALERGEYLMAFAALDQAMAGLRPDDPGMVCVLHQIGYTSWLAGDLDRAEHMLAMALRQGEQLGDPVIVPSVRTHLSVVQFYRGRLGVSERMAADSLARFAELDFKQGTGWAWNVLGLVALRRGQLERAVAALRASLQLHCTVGDRWRQASVLDALAAAAVASGAVVRGAELAGLAAAVREVLRVPVPAQERPDWEHTHQELRQLLDGGELRSALARGAGLRVTDVAANLQRPHELPDPVLIRR